MAGAFYPNYFRWSEVDEQEAERILVGHDPHTTVMLSGLPLSRHNELFYTPDIVRYFEECGRIKQIHYDSGRAYLEFQRLRLYSDEWDAVLSVSGSTLTVPAVYTALKMRQLRNGNITITTTRPSDGSGRQSRQSLMTPQQVAWLQCFPQNPLFTVLSVSNNAIILFKCVKMRQQIP